MQQTELARLAPPSQGSKARVHERGGVVDWGIRTLAFVDDPARLASLGITAARVREKLGWLEGYRSALEAWSGYQR